MTTVEETTKRAGWRRPNAILIVAIALVVAAAAVGGWFAVAWIKAGGDELLDRSRTRDEVNRVAGAAIITFTTIDYRDPDQSLEARQGASTGTLLDQVIARRASDKQAIEQSKVIATPVVLSSAVTELEDYSGKATVIAALKVTVAPEGQQSGDKYLRIQVFMQRTDAGWKISGLNEVPYTPAG